MKIQRGSARRLAQKTGLSDAAVSAKRKQGKTDLEIAAEAKNRRQSKRDKETYSAAQTRKEIALANLRELELAKRRGELVTIADATEGWNVIVSNARTRLLGLPMALSRKVACEDDPAVCESIIRKALHEALFELSRRTIEELRANSEQESSEGTNDHIDK
jgi:hypothetical protein